MNLFQTITLITIGIIGIFQLVNLKNKPFIKILYGLRWFLVFLMAFVVIAHPSVSRTLANITGISRGADLIIYSAILFLLVKSYMDSKKIDNLESRIDSLIRKTAISRYTHKDPSKDRI